MKLIIDFGRFEIPSYGIMIAIGMTLANIIIYFILKRFNIIFEDLLIVEAYGILGGFIGAKLLYLIVSIDSIDWKKFFQIDYFNRIMQGGFVFYGGLIGGLLFVIIAGKIHHLKINNIINCCIVFVPFVHSFGRLGCFLAGCCYGIPYNGFGAVVFPEKSFAMSGIPLFPVQLVEAVCLMLISLSLLYLLLKKEYEYLLEIYLISYGILRFFLEYLRYDKYRGIFFHLSTSQWISVLMIFVGTTIILIKICR